MISALILTKDSQDTIKLVLNNITSLVEEIIIIDDFSTDNTISIASKYTNNIYKRKLDNFSKQRNYGISKLIGPWVLSLDSDELLSIQLINKLQQIKKSKLINEYGSYLFKRRNYISENRWLKYGLFYPDWQLRLFRKDIGFHFEGIVHEWPISIKKLESSKIEEGYIVHLPNRTKYNSFKSIKRLRKFIKFEELLYNNRNIPFIIYPFIGFYKFIYYFYQSFILGKGFLDGWAGFRAAIIFGLQFFIGSINAFITKFKLLRYK